MAYRNKSYADKLLIGINQAILCRQEPCRHSDDSSRDELIFKGSYSGCFEKQFEAARRQHRASTARDCGSRDGYTLRPRQPHLSRPAPAEQTVDGNNIRYIRHRSQLSTTPVGE